MLSRMSYKCQINIDYAQPNKLISVYIMSNNHGRPFLTFVIAIEIGARFSIKTLHNANTTNSRSQFQYRFPSFAIG